MKSDTEVVYDESKGKKYLNENVLAKGWGTKQVGGVIAKLNSQRELHLNAFI
jgi:hypothetical protein